MVVMGLFLALAPSALASTTWYVDGVNGNDGNNCTSAQTACKTIGIIYRFLEVAKKNTRHPITQSSPSHHPFILTFGG
jgi:hypothetical protein